MNFAFPYHQFSFFKFILFVAYAFLTYACAEDIDVTIPASKISIPQNSDWTDAGTAIEKGKPGSWELRLEGAISPGAMIKKNGSYFLYYIGADGDRSTDGGPRHRALGLATSSDGINFVKYAANPIITHLPHHNEEEGIFSVAAMIDADGTVILYYGAMDAGNATSTSVDGDVRLAVSNDGIHFSDVGDVLSHSDKSIWGFGDELFPVGVFRSEGTFYVYYIAKGWRAKWDLGLAWGLEKDKLIDSKAVIKSGDWVVGGGDAVILDDYVIALFLFRVTSPEWKNTYLDIRIAPTRCPSQLSAQVEKYVDFGHTLVYLDRENARWFMYYFNRDGNISVRWAVAQYSGN
jgi:sucrose-6-phosphate hydrolase SacC (GH32 family)